MGRSARLLGAIATALAIARPCAALTVRYAAPDGCPTAAMLRDAVGEGLVGGPLEGSETLEVEVAADRRSARLTLLDGAGRVLGSRTVASDAGDCEALVRAAGLSAAVALAPLRRASVEPARPAAPVVPEPVEAPRAPAAGPTPSPPAPTASGAEVRGGVSWGVGAALGLHPGVAVSVDGGVRIGRGRWSGLAEVRLSAAPAWLDGEVDGGRVPGVGLAGGVWACGRRGALGLCGGALGGLEVYVGRGFARGGDSLGPWVAGGLRGLWTAFGDWGPRVEVLVPISRLTLTVDGRAAWTTPPVAVAAGVGGRL